MKEKMSQDALLERMIGEFTKAFPGIKIKEKGFGLELKSKDGLSMVANFHSLYDEINSGSDIEGPIANRIYVFKQNFKALKKMDPKAPRITKKLLKEHGIYLAKDDTFLKHVMENSPKTKPQEIVSKPLAVDIHKCGAIDHDRYQMFLTTEMVKNMKIEEVHKILQEGTDNKKLTIEVVDDKIQRLDNYPIKLLIAHKEATQISTLLCSAKQMLKFSKGKRHMAVMPFRDFMVLAPLKEIKDEKKRTAFELPLFMELWQLAKSMHADKFRPYPISEKPFIINEQGQAETFKSDMIKDGVLMAVSIDKETGKKEIAGMLKL